MLAPTLSLVQWVTDRKIGPQTQHITCHTIEDTKAGNVEPTGRDADRRAVAPVALMTLVAVG